MSVSEELSNYIGLIYQSPNDDSDWVRMATQLMERTNSCALLISAVDTARGNIVRSNLFGSESSRFSDGFAEYENGLFVEDPSLAFALRHPTAGFCDSSKAIPGPDYLNHPFIRWNADRLGATHWIVGYTPPRDGSTLGVSLHTPRAIGHMEPDAEQLFRFVFPHIVHAVRLASRPVLVDSDDEAVFLLNAAGHVVQCNQRAHELIAKGDGISVRDGQIMPCVNRVRDPFERLVRKTCRTAIADSQPHGLRLPRPSGRKDLLLRLEPLPPSNGIAAAFGAVAMVRIIDPTEHPRVQAHHADLFGLSDRETEVADLLVGGHSPETVASVLGISLATVRIHLRSLLRKTETGRQSELIELLTRTR